MVVSLNNPQLLAALTGIDPPYWRPRIRDFLVKTHGGEGFEFTTTESEEALRRDLRILLYYWAGQVHQFYEGKRMTLEEFGLLKLCRHIVNKDLDAYSLNLEVLVDCMYENAHPGGRNDPSFVPLTKAENHFLWGQFDEIWIDQANPFNMEGPRCLLRMVEGIMVGKNPGKWPSYRRQQSLDYPKGLVVLSTNLLKKMEQEELAWQMICCIGED